MKVCSIWFHASGVCSSGRCLLHMHRAVGLAARHISIRHGTQRVLARLSVTPRWEPACPTHFCVRRQGNKEARKERDDDEGALLNSVEFKIHCMKVRNARGLGSCRTQSEQFVRCPTVADIEPSVLFAGASERVEVTLLERGVGQ